MEFVYKHKLPIIFVVLVVCLMAGITIAIQFVQGKNTWVCKNGDWVRVGSPQSSQPTTICPGEKSEDYPSIPPDSTVTGLYTTLIKSSGNNDPSQTNRYLASSYSKPALCADEKLQKFLIGKSQSARTQATVHVTLTFETKTASATVQLVGAKGKWEITKINCQTP